MLDISQTYFRDIRSICSYMLCISGRYFLDMWTKCVMDNDFFEPYSVRTTE